MNIIEVNDYRKILKLKQKIIKKTNPTITLDFLATKSRIQKSYLSRVFNGQIHLTTEQLYTICELLSFSKHEKKYCLLLLNYQRSSNSEYKKYLKPEIKKLKQEYAGARDDIKAESLAVDTNEIIAYYANTFISIVHMYLCVDEYAKYPLKIASKLRISKDTLTDILNHLEKLQIIQRDTDNIKVMKQELHIPTSNPLAKIHQTNQRSLANAILSRDLENKNYFFSASFSTSPKVIDQIRQEFYYFLNKAQTLTKKSKDREVYHLNFDLFTI